MFFSGRLKWASVSHFHKGRRRQVRKGVHTQRAETTLHEARTAYLDSDPAAAHSKSRGATDRRSLSPRSDPRASFCQAIYFLRRNEAERSRQFHQLTRPIIARNKFKQACRQVSDTSTDGKITQYNFVTNS